MSSWNQLWLPQSDSTNASPSEYDMHKAINSQLIQAARVDTLLMSRLMVNNTAMYSKDGVVNREVDFTLTGGIGTETHLKNDRFSGMNMDQIQRSVTLDRRPRRTGIEEENITRMFEQVPAVRNQVTGQLGYALGSWDEVEGMKAIVDASQYTTSGSEDTTEFLEGGNKVISDALSDATWSQLSTATSGETKALEILDKLEDIAIIWGETSVPLANRHVILTPEDYWALIKLERPWSDATDIAGGIYGNTDIVSEKVPFSAMVDTMRPIGYRGFNIYGHNLFTARFNKHLTGLQNVHTLDPNHSSRGSEYNSGDLSKVQAIVFQSEAVGKADVMSVMIKQGEVPMSTNEYINAMTWVGYGTLNPNYAVTLDIA